MKTAIGMTLTAALAVPAYAGGGAALDEPEVIQPPRIETAAPYDWTGPYAGLTFGFGKVTSNAATPDQSAVGAAAHAGYNLDMGDWVMGGQIDLAPAALADLSVGTREIGNSGSLKLRAGPKLGGDGRSFAFGTLGGAHVRSSNAGTSYSDSGWLIGAGVAHALDESWFVTGELDHFRFKDVAGTGNDVRATTATAGFSFRF